MKDLLFELILMWYFSGLCLLGFEHFLVVGIYRLLIYLRIGGGGALFFSTKGMFISNRNSQP